MPAEWKCGYEPAPRISCIIIIIIIIINGRETPGFIIWQQL